jgi:hypothetical protein
LRPGPHQKIFIEAVIHRNLVTVCCVAQSSPSWLKIRALAVNVRFHQHWTFDKKWQAAKLRTFLSSGQ